MASRKRMAVETRALVARRNIGEAMGSLEAELFEDLHGGPHGIPSNLCVWRLSLHRG